MKTNSTPIDALRAMREAEQIKAAICLSVRNYLGLPTGKTVAEIKEAEAIAEANSAWDATFYFGSGRQHRSGKTYKGLVDALQENGHAKDFVASHFSFDDAPLLARGFGPFGNEHEQYRHNILAAFQSGESNRLTRKGQVAKSVREAVR